MIPEYKASNYTMTILGMYFLNKVVHIDSQFSQFKRFVSLSALHHVSITPWSKHPSKDEW